MDETFEGDTVFKRILVAVDGSHTADQALEQAIKLVKELQSQLRIVHVVDVVNIMGAEFIDSTEFSGAITKNGQEILNKAEAVARQAEIPVETRLIVIDSLGYRIPEMIAADAETWSADLIVIGTHGRRGLSRLFLG